MCLNITDVAAVRTGAKSRTGDMSPQMNYARAPYAVFKDVHIISGTHAPVKGFLPLFRTFFSVEIRERPERGSSGEREGSSGERIIRREGHPERQAKHKETGSSGERIIRREDHPEREGSSGETSQTQGERIIRREDHPERGSSGERVIRRERDHPERRSAAGDRRPETGDRRPEDRYRAG